LAAAMISQANEIRFLGYSLPSTDHYFKYLLTTAIAYAEDAYNLKRIDVICLDPDGQVEERYKALFDFPNFNFNNTLIEDYLNNPYGQGYPGDRFQYPTMEEAHRYLFK
jgi:hypothetical protein